MNKYHILGTPRISENITFSPLLELMGVQTHKIFHQLKWAILQPLCWVWFGTSHLVHISSNNISQQSQAILNEHMLKIYPPFVSEYGTVSRKLNSIWIHMISLAAHWERWISILYEKFAVLYWQIWFLVKHQVAAFCSTSFRPNCNLTCKVP